MSRTRSGRGERGYERRENRRRRHARSTLRGTLILLLSVGHRRWDASRRASSARLVANVRRTSCPAALAGFQKITILPSFFFSFSFFFLCAFSTPRPCLSKMDGFFFPPRFEKIRNMGYDDAFLFFIGKMIFLLSFFFLFFFALHLSYISSMSIQDG